MFYSLCVCGCGQEVQREGDKFLLGHEKLSAAAAPVQDAAPVVEPPVVLPPEPEIVETKALPPAEPPKVDELLADDLGAEVHLVAADAMQMASSQAKLVSWIRAKLAECRRDRQELEEAREHAQAHKWRTSTFTNQLAKLEKRRVFYHKLLIAAEAGYTIIPSFPIDIIAVRVDKDEPSDTQTHEWDNRSMPTANLAERAQALEVGSGRYISPLPQVRRHAYDTKDSRNQNVRRHSVRAIALRDMEFPVSIAVPEVMDATARAMSLKVFDQIGVCPAKNIRVDNHRLAQAPPVKDPDPLIIGQIGMPEKWGGLTKPVSFLIAWHLDLRTL